MTGIRFMAADDLALVRRWRNHPAVRYGMLSRHEIGEEEHRRWFAGAARDPRRLLLIYEEDRLPRGFVHFEAADDGVAEWGFYAAPDAPPGTGKKLCRAGLAFAFPRLDCHKVRGQVLDFNAVSLHLHHRLGFQLESIRREYQCIDGRYHDLHCFGLPRGRWSAGAAETAA